jgi:putative N6-adenine-specific DNA methylase
MVALGIPAGWFRDFAFTGWPAFPARRWAYLRRTAYERRPAAAPIYASDRDLRACQALQGTVRDSGLETAVKVACRDFFDVDPGRRSASGGLVVINPPYGRRMGSATAGRRLSKDIHRHLRTAFRNWRLAMLVPGGAPEPAFLAGLEHHSLLHGGLRLGLCVGRIP